MAGFIEGVDRGQSVLSRIGWRIGLVKTALSASWISLSKNWICSILVSPALPLRELDVLAIILLCCSSCSSTAT